MSRPTSTWAQYESLVHLMHDGFKQHAARDAYAYMDRHFTFGEIDRYSAAFGAWLQGQGLARGARVAIMLPNVVQYPIALAGALRAGCVVVNVNPLYTPRELEHQLQDSGAEAIVILENFAATLQQVIARTAIKHVVVASLGEMLRFPKGAIVDFAVRRIRKLVPAFSLPGHMRFTETLDAGARRGLEPVKVGPQDVAFLQYTGGTTGVSKGATLTHRNLVANVLQMEAWVAPALNDTSRGPVPEQFVYVCALPLYHVFALVVNCLFGHPSGHAERADHQSPRHPGVREGNREVQVQRHPGRQHAVQRARRERRSSASSTSRACASRTAAAWRCSARSPKSGWRSPACRSSRATACRKRRRSPPATRS